MKATNRRTGTSISPSLSAVKRSNTKPELALRSALHARGRRFRVDHRLDLSDGRVRPDLAFSRLKVAVFVDGCYWHRCPDHCRIRGDVAFWEDKLTKNVIRDQHNDQVLIAAGWTVVRIWEHIPLGDAVAMVERALGCRQGFQ